METFETTRSYPVSEMAENLVGSEIIKLALEVKAKISKGQKIYNLTIGDFNPEIFPIPQELEDAIVDAYRSHETNYPAAQGIPELRDAVSHFISRRGGFHYGSEQILISGGARPIIFAAYSALVNPGEKIVFPVPSWNNNHYTHLMRAKMVCFSTHPENNFMPTASDIAPFISEAGLIALCSPLNPTGTVFRKKTLEEICDLILDENRKRGPEKKPIYLLYDQVYWQLMHGDAVHYDPVSLRTDMRNYTIFIDGISKCFAATGVRVGWSYGPTNVINKMKAICTHMGSWAPKPEQVATAKYLRMEVQVDTFINNFKLKLSNRLNEFYKGFMKMKKNGYRVMAIPPQAALYLSVQIDYIGTSTIDGVVISSTEELTSFLINQAGVAIVPFSYFGTSSAGNWYRLSVGTAQIDDIPDIFISLRMALEKLR